MLEREAILLVRLDGVGDAALCVPALEGMRRAFPDASFGAVCSNANASLFSDRIAHIHVYDDEEPVTTLRSALREQGYTRALIATEEVAGYQLGRLSGAARRAGFWHGLQKPFKSLWQRMQVTAPVYRPAAWTPSPEHEVTTLYRLAEVLGARAPAPVEPQDLRNWLRVERSDLTRPAEGALAFQITPKLLTGGWGPTTIAQLASVALEASGRNTAVLLASAQDEALACSVLGHMPASVARHVEVLASLTLPRWLGALDCAAALVTPDTGAAHVAGMLGAGVVDLFDEADFERLSQQWHPWAGLSRCLVKSVWLSGLEENLGRQIGEAVRTVTTK
ncbi:MAG TPA: glycosyltransferase family 9 protein [Candidatus Eremiobacteraceae bacterium]|nr:glycosyltransferase family 9 protein [Candidatus Eremiobacteraceae bacterium]